MAKKQKWGNIQEETPKYPPDDLQEMAKLKGFTSIEAMVEFFIDKQMSLYYSKKEEK